MLNLGIVRPGTTIYIPWDTFDGGTGASITSTGLATTDIEVYKDGSITQRASDNGYTLLDTDGIDLDGITGIQGISINLADNSTAGFYAAGSSYWVVISSVTIDAQTVNFIAAYFTIGYPDAVLNTTIATLSTQTSFTLTAGPAEDDALNGCVVVIHDVASAVQLGTAVISDYTGASKTVTLTAGVSFTAAATDNISIFHPANSAWGGAVAYTATRGLAGTALPAAAADAAGGLIISDAGGLDADAQLVTKINDILTDTGTTLQAEVDGIQADTEDIQSRLPAALVGGRIDATVDGTGMEAGAVAVISDGVWDEDATAHQTGGTFGQAIGDPGASTETLFKAIITDPAGTNIAADVIAIKAETALIVADTNELQTDWADGGRLDLLIDAIKAKTDNLPTDPADQSAVEARIATAETAIVDAILDNIRIQKNTALADFAFFLIDETDGFSGLTGATVTATRSIDGAAFAACANAVAELSGGWYVIDLADTDLNGNSVALNFAATGAITATALIFPQPKD